MRSLLGMVGVRAPIFSEGVFRVGDSTSTGLSPLFATHDVLHAPVVD
jgi:hypothetical protein